MDEFRKSYEYVDEENRVSGFLLVFFLMLLVFETFFGGTVLIQLYLALRPIAALAAAAAAIGVLYVAFILFTCYTLFRLRKYAVRAVKIFLVSRVLTLIVSSIITLINELNKKAWSGDILLQYSSAQDAVLKILVLPTIYILSFSILWFLYFLKSKKVKTMYSIDSGAKM